MPRSTPDYPAIEVLNTILGGAFTSRLNQNLREKNGYSYGTYSQFLFRRSPGPFVVAGGLKAVYDLALYFTFRRVRLGDE